MRYILQAEFADETNHRRDYLYKIFHLWFIVSIDKNENRVLTSMPDTSQKYIVFIVGHNSFVKRYICTKDLTGKTIVAITCDGYCKFKKKKISCKHLFLPYLNTIGYAELLTGYNYGFDFNLTESEIQFYNSPKNWSIEKRILCCFERYK